ncbi:MAG: hypothetical protein Q9220_000383 [cf. Caloplaca sp. 1 TL-2023]
MYKNTSGLTGPGSGYKPNKDLYKVIGGITTGPKLKQESKPGSSIERLASKISDKISNTKPRFCSADVTGDCHTAKHLELGFTYCKAHKYCCAEYRCPVTPLIGQECPKHGREVYKKNGIKLGGQSRIFRNDDYERLEHRREIKFAEGTREPVMQHRLLLDVGVDPGYDDKIERDDHDLLDWILSRLQ